MEGTNFLEDYGDLDQLARQITINQKLGLPTPFYCYKSWNPRAPSLRILEFCIPFIEKHGLVTVRQVYYGLVSAQVLESATRNYRQVVRVLVRARLAGIIPFDRIVDDTREAEKTPSWDNIEAILEAAIEQYRSDWWEDQPYYVEVWLEKRSLRRIFLPITDSYDVYLYIGGGYESWTMVWTGNKRFKKRLKNRFEEHIRRGQIPIILYFGDLNPSGKDMPRDIRQRFKTLGLDVRLIEVALTPEDIEEYNLPRNPTKPKDTRNKWYKQKYGINYAVELDALPPEVLREKIHQAIRSYTDSSKMNAHIYKDRLDKARWHRIIEGNRGTESQ